MNSKRYRVLAIMPHKGQMQILTAPARFRVVACGRRFGKTETGKLLVLAAALYHGKTCWWLAPTHQMASQVWRDLKAMLRHVPALQISETERRIDLPFGGQIAIRSTHDPDNLRGAGLDFAVLDEAAFMHPSVWPQVIRPMLADRRGGALFLSTPRGKNFYWELFKLGIDPEEPDWAAFHFTSYDNPHIPRAELDAIQRVTPDHVWHEEYLARFNEDAGQVFRGVNEVATAPHDAQPQPQHTYIFGVDFAMSQDFTVIVVMDADSGQMVALDRFHRVDWALQRGRIAALVERWHPAVIWAEANSAGAPNIEALQQAGLPVRPFVTTAHSKRAVIERLALAIERREIALLPDAVLLGELVSFEMERLPAGGYRYSAPPGGHDDCVIALALAWHGVQYAGVTVDFA